MVLTGRFDHVIDEKGRLAIPSQIRNQMNPETDGSGFYLVSEDKYLQLIPEKLFEALASQHTTGLVLSEEEALASRALYSLSTKLDLDKQGRVMIPDGLMEDSENADLLARKTIKREVTLVGNGDRIEIWNRAEYIREMQAVLTLRDMFKKTMQAKFGVPPAKTGSNPMPPAPNN
jgi:MraZ protein